MSSMKKNVLAVALVAGLGMAGAAAAYNYGTAANAPTGTGIAGVDADSSSSNPAGLWVPEIVSYEMLTANAYNWTMAEDLVFDIQIPDNAVQVSTGYTVRVRLNRNNCVPSGAPYPASDTTCTSTGEGALFNTANIPTAGAGPGQLELNATLLAAGWTAEFDGYYDGGETASIRIRPPAGTQANPGPGVMLRWHNPQLTSHCFCRHRHGECRVLDGQCDQRQPLPGLDPEPPDPAEHPRRECLRQPGSGGSRQVHRRR